MNQKQLRAVHRVQLRLRNTIHKWSELKAEAQWTNGYRTGKYGKSEDDAEEQRLYDKEMAQWERAGKAERTMERMLTKALSAAPRRRSHP